MLNDLKRSYDRYSIMHADGRDEPVSREKCFARAETPTADNPFVQRWWASPEGKDGGYIIRLPRNAEGERLYHQNEAMRIAEWRLNAKDRECIGKEVEGYCDRKCKECCERITRTVPLDKPVQQKDESEIAIDLPSEDLTPDEVFLLAESSSEIYAALKQLPKGQEEIVRLRYLQDLSAVEIAEKLGCSRQYANKALRQAKPLLEKLLEKFLK